MTGIFLADVDFFGGAAFFGVAFLIALLAGVALLALISRRRPDKNNKLMFHSDHGGHYASDDFNKKRYAF